MNWTVRAPARAAILALVAVSACSERQDDGLDPVPGSETVEVRLANFTFTPAAVTIDRGTTVRWRNTTGTFHTVTPDGNTVFQEWQTNAQGQTFDVRFDQPGTYRYYCSPHRVIGMMGVITVR